MSVRPCPRPYHERKDTFIVSPVHTIPPYSSTKLRLSLEAFPAAIMFAQLRQANPFHVGWDWSAIACGVARLFGLTGGQTDDHGLRAVERGSARDDAVGSVQ